MLSNAHTASEIPGRKIPVRTCVSPRGLPAEPRQRQTLLASGLRTNTSGPLQPAQGNRILASVCSGRFREIWKT